MNNKLANLSSLRIFGLAAGAALASDRYDDGYYADGGWGGDPYGYPGY